MSPNEPSRRQYAYVGPEDIRKAASKRSSGKPIVSTHDLVTWLNSNVSDRESNGTYIATFVVDCDGTLRLAHRRSEHIACAAGDSVLGG